MSKDDKVKFFRILNQSPVNLRLCRRDIIGFDRPGVIMEWESLKRDAFFLYLQKRMPNTSILNTQGYVWDCTYHIVIVPKYRKKILFDLFREQAREILRELSKQKGIEITKGND